ncbi:uncharacterized protein LOC121267971 [Juglans microcarpa x Juglans regia]|uniref:uncharacterized protein LOC121267971 n=1 Tax=Juglans microcarpa x Juglans regia TaxID=2249226 RepID=UPI001B7F4362|nr:uncharacterized protein LOC121267971 [Juglans microcarpa x Juglans regia]
MAKDKALGPNGFSMVFFQVCWKIVKEDVMLIFQEFFSFKKSEISFNATFIALIPKKAGPLNSKDFRLISLVSEVYKIISKVLANQISKMMEQIISKPQNVFVLSRQILDSVLIANECLDNQLREGAPNVLYDTIIFCDVECGHIQALGAVLLCFEVVLGLKVNLGKSELVSIGEELNINSLTRLLGCKIALLPMKYLDLPFEASFTACAIWDGVVEKVERRSASWKRLYLSKGGRLTLLKSTLCNLPTYFLSLFPLPTRVANQIEKLFRAFLWDGMAKLLSFISLVGIKFVLPFRLED